MADERRWSDYYAVTVDRPAWHTVTEAAALFAAEDAAAGRAGPRFAVDLGSGAGRDARELLQRGWRVLAVDSEPDAADAVRTATPDPDQPRLETLVADIGSVDIPTCDLVNASVSLQFLDTVSVARVFERITAALQPGGRFTALIYGDRDEAAGEPDVTCLSAEQLRSYLAAFELESWTEREEDGQMALGDPHHIHMFEVVARRIAR